jgi:hypothetical protein
MGRNTSNNPVGNVKKNYLKHSGKIRINSYEKKKTFKGKHISKFREQYYII